MVGPRVLALLFAGSTERVCYAAVAVFLPTYLLTRYAMDAPHLALGLGWWPRVTCWAISWAAS
jgi:hypothetical protein